MKSFLTILRAMLMTFAVVGCGGGDDATDTADSAVDSAPSVEMPAGEGEGEGEKPAEGEGETPAEGEGEKPAGGEAEAEKPAE